MGTLRYFSVTCFSQKKIEGKRNLIIYKIIQILVLLSVILIITSVFNNTSHFVKNLVILEATNLMVIYFAATSATYASLSNFFIIFIVVSLSGAAVAVSIIIHISAQ